jgi:hypothetical protein
LRTIAIILALAITLVIGILIGLRAKDENEEVPQDVHNAIAAVNVAGLLKSMDPTLSNEMALVMAEGVMEWAQALHQTN